MPRALLAAVALVALGPPAVLTATGASASDGPAALRTAPAPAYSVAARLSTRDVIAGEDVVRVVGTVRPTSAAGRTVVLQQRAAGSTRWRRSGWDRVGANGRFVLKDRPSTPGVRFYRVVKPASRTVEAGTSRELRVEVWRWEPLVHRVASRQGGVAIGSAQLGGRTYPDSIMTSVAGETGDVTYLLGRSCRTLRASYGMTDTSVGGASGRISVLDPGGNLSFAFVETGTIESDRLTDISGAARVEISMLTTSAPAGYAAIGTPEVLCLE